MEKNEFSAAPSTIAGVDLKHLDRELRETTQNDCDRDPADVATDALTVIAELLAGRASAVRSVDTSSAMSTVSAKAGTPSVPPKAVDSATHSEIMRTVGSLASSPLPRAAPARPGFTFDLSELQPGELYVGVVRSGGISRHLILLPAEASGVSWQQAKTFAAAVGGELPDMGDFDVLLQNAQHEFAEDDSYWSSEWLNKQEALYLDFGPHPFRDWDSVDALMRARAVRRTFAGLEQAVLLNWGAHIKRMREAAGLTEDQLAELVDVTPDVVRRWEGGEVRTIDGPLLMQICAALNVDPGWLLGADDE